MKNSEAEACRSLREIELEVESEMREWGRQRLQDKRIARLPWILNLKLLSNPKRPLIIDVRSVHLHARSVRRAIHVQLKTDRLSGESC